MDTEQTFRPQQAWSWGGAIPEASSTGLDPNIQHASAESRNRHAGRDRPTPNPAPKPEHDQHAEARADTDPETETPQHQPEPQAQQDQQHQRQRHYRPRTCRICLDTVQPSFEVDTGAMANHLFGANPRVRYVSDDPDLGRLISPCKCKGSQRYVHEGCLQAWRQQAPLNDRNFWHCPTCNFRYRMTRLRWATWLTSRVTRVALTLLVLFVAIFLLGFVADPIINLWVDPYGTIVETVSEVLEDHEDVRHSGVQPDGEEDEQFTWALHLIKGVFSLGLLGAVKMIVNPFQWWHLRNGGMLGGGRAGRRGNGRERMENISWFVVVIGIITFLGFVWRTVSVFSERMLEKVSNRVLDIPGDGNDDDEEDDNGDAGENGT